MFDYEDHMTAKTAKTAKAATAAKAATTAKPTTKRAGTTNSRTKRRQPSHTEIAERAYYIHLDEGGPDELGNWLRAERELTAA